MNLINFLTHSFQRRNNVVKAVVVYLIMAFIIIGAGYFLLEKHPNHAQIEVAWIIGLGFPLLPAYITFREGA